jgi:hypothetical protein
MNIGDLRQFAKTYGKWLYGINPDLDGEKLQGVIEQFARSAPIAIGESSTLNFDAFCQEAARSYTGEKGQK